MAICVYPGSFDPVTKGHINIIERASKIFDKVYVLVSTNTKKHYLFSIEEKIRMLEKSLHIENVEIAHTEGMVVAFAQEKGASVILRGIRNPNDYQNELEISYFNHSIDPNIETMLMYADRDNLFTSSSSIKELILCEGDAHPFLPEEIAEEVIQKIKNQPND